MAKLIIFPGIWLTGKWWTVADIPIDWGHLKKAGTKRIRRRVMSGLRKRLSTCPIGLITVIIAVI